MYMYTYIKIIQYVKCAYAMSSCTVFMFDHHSGQI